MEPKLNNVPLAVVFYIAQRVAKKVIASDLSPELSEKIDKAIFNQLVTKNLKKA